MSVPPSPTIRCTPFEPSTDCTYKYCDRLVEVEPVELPATPLAPHWRLQPCILPAKYERFAEAIAAFEVRPDDLWVVTYPKCGTTWTQEMLRMMLTDLDYEKAATIPLEEQFSFLEAVMMFDKPEEQIPNSSSEFVLSSVERAHNLPSPRFIKTHLPIELLPRQMWTVKPRIVYMARNPKDTAVSFYHHYRNMHGFRGTMEAFLEAFLAEEVIYSPFATHVYNFWLARHEPNVLFLTFEQMKENIMSVLQMTQSFLGKEFSMEQLLKLSAHLHVDNMRQNGAANNTILVNELKEILNEEHPDENFQ